MRQDGKSQLVGFFVSRIKQGWPKEDLHMKLEIFVLPLVSDWTNVFIVTWVSYAEEELTRSDILQGQALFKWVK